MIYLSIYPSYLSSIYPYIISTHPSYPSIHHIYPSIHPSNLSIHLSFFKWPEAKDLKTRRKREKENLFLHWISNLNKKLSLKSVIKDQSKQITNQKEHKWYLEVANGNVTRKARWSFLPLNRLREKDKNIMKTESFEDMMRKGGMLQKLEAIQK